MYYNRKTLEFYPDRFAALQDYDNSRFYFHDLEFAKADWTQEPSKTLPELYRARAEQIRRDYEYIILAYSGGIDSTNMLETFYYNNIHIDEILVVGALSQDSRSESDENHNGDLYFNVFPTLKKLDLPHTKITVEDYTKYFSDVNNFSIFREHGTDWPYELECYFSPHCIYWRDLKSFIGSKNDKKTAVVFGLEPTVVNYDIQSQKYYTEFMDSAYRAYGTHQLENFEKVHFYTDPNTIDIIKKQAHIVKNFYQEHNITLCLENAVAKQLYYNVKHPLVFKSKKCTNYIISPRDRYLLDNTNSDLFKLYSVGLSELSKKITIPRNIGIHSQRYYL